MRSGSTLNRWSRQIRITMVVGLSLFVSTSSLQAEFPSPEEQLWLQLINRFRADPVGELDLISNYITLDTGEEFADPKANNSNVAEALDFFEVDAAILRQQFQQLEAAPPLAWSESLHRSAEYYSDLMIETDSQSHDLDGLNLLDRVQTAGGFDFSGGGRIGENIFAYTEDVEHGHAGFIIDWGVSPTGIQNPPGHRDSLINPEFREVGISILSEADDQTIVGPLVTTQHLGVDYADGPYLTGAIFSDTDENDFYSIGEGLTDVTVQLQRLNGEVVASAEAYASGGYRIDLSELSEDSYRIVLATDSPVFWSADMTLSDDGDNVGLDLKDPQYDIDSITRAIQQDIDWQPYDLNQDGQFTTADRDYLINEIFHTFYGDANLDGEFNSTDLVQVLVSGEYEDQRPLNSTWSTGDWNGDLEFTTGDLVLALSAGGYEKGPKSHPIPEPTSISLLLLPLLWSGRSVLRAKSRSEFSASPGRG